MERQTQEMKSVSPHPLTTGLEIVMLYIWHSKWYYFYQILFLISKWDWRNYIEAKIITGCSSSILWLCFIASLVLPTVRMNQVPLLSPLVSGQLGWVQLLQVIKTVKSTNSLWYMVIISVIMVIINVIRLKTVESSSVFVYS